MSKVHPMSARLGAYQHRVDLALAELKANEICSRIWQHDHTVWQPQPDEVSNRLGWLHSLDAMYEVLPDIEEFVAEVRTSGYTKAILLGMGGSSLAPEVLRKAFGAKEDYLDLEVLDSTDPGAVRELSGRIERGRTLFIVSTKSGSTVETLSFYKYFYNDVARALQGKDAGAQFIAITDSGSTLEKIAVQQKFRHIFLNDPDIGGRYSALSYFGLVPAALTGIDIELLLERAKWMQGNCQSGDLQRRGGNSGAFLGATMAELAKAGRDKLTFMISPRMSSFGDWLEQLIAESTGKEGKGIVPVVGETPGPPESYGGDRLFVSLQLEGDVTYKDAVENIAGAGHPFIRMQLRDLYDLGGQMFLWEMATAVAGQRLGINPFDQPNVEAAKVIARQMIDSYLRDGELPRDQPAPLRRETVERFLSQASPGDYIAIQAFVQPADAMDRALEAVRSKLRNRYRVATTVGYGPRFLHSTGQLHKGGAGNGLFIQLTSASKQDVAIPDEAGSPASSIGFGVLKIAQALGDKRALVDAGRRVIRFDLSPDPMAGLQQMEMMIP